MSGFASRRDGIDHLDRREFFRVAGGGALAAALLSPVGPLCRAALARSPGAAQEGKEAKKQKRGKGAAEEVTGPYAPFKMALQSYSLRKFGFEKMIETLWGLEIKFVELYPAHFPGDLSESERRSRLRIMRHNGIKSIAYGVVSFTSDHEKNRKLFQFARDLNLASLSADPAPDSFESLDKLVEEYRIPVAIHNHGPEDKRYRTPEMIEKAIKDHHRLIGLCVDTGHFLRVDVNPVEVVKQFKDRVYGVHLKEVKTEAGKKVFKVLGEGDLDTVGLLRALKEHRFQGGLSLEYEEEEDAPIPSIKKCLEVVREAVRKS